MKKILQLLVGMEVYHVKSTCGGVDGDGYDAGKGHDVQWSHGTAGGVVLAAVEKKRYRVLSDLSSSSLLAAETTTRQQMSR